jgi:hypothetical protein
MSIEKPATWLALPPSMDEMQKVNYNDVEFYVARYGGVLYFNDTPLKATELRGEIYNYATGTYTPRMGFVTLKCKWSTVECWSGDSSCAYKRYMPKGADHKDFKSWLDYYLADMDYRKAVTCYLTKQDGKIKDILPTLVKNGFNQVAVNKSIHEGAYNVYLLVHPGTTVDPGKFLGSIYKKANNEDDKRAIEELE